MSLLPNVDALLAATQSTYADALDLTEACIAAAVHGRPDLDRIRVLRRYLADAPHFALAGTVTLQAGFLAIAATELSEAAGGRTPADMVANWRRQAALAVDLTEANLAGEAR